jgi:hypothetical protein
VPIGSHILLITSSDFYEFINNKFNGGNLKLVLLSQLGSMSPSDGYLICATESELRDRRNQKFLDTVYHVIHYEGIDSIDAYHLRMKYVSYVAYTYVFFTNEDQDQIREFL